MPINLESFEHLANTGAARLEVDPSGQQLVAKGTDTKGRIVEWFRKQVGSAQEQNKTTINSFVNAIRQRYGDASANHAEDALQERLDQGKRLSARRVQTLLGQTKGIWEQQQKQELIEEKANLFSDLGTEENPGTPRNAINMMLQNGTITQDDAKVLLDPNSQQHQSLVRATKQAVTQALNKPSSSPADGEGAALRATFEQGQRVATARKFADELFTPSENGKRSPAVQAMAEVLQRLGLPDDVLEGLTKEQLENAKTQTARLIFNLDLAQSEKVCEPCKGIAQTALLPVVTERLLRVLLDSQLTEEETKHLTAEDLLKNLDAAALIGPSEPGDMPRRLLFELVRKVFAPGSQATEGVQQALAKKLVDAFEQQPRTTADQQIDVMNGLVKLLGNWQQDVYRSLSPEDRERFLQLRLAGQLAEHQRAASQQQDTSLLRSNALHTAADLVTLRLQAIMNSKGCSELEALDELKEQAPALVEKMDSVLSEQRKEPVAGDWIEHRKLLLQLREAARALAKDKTGGLEMQGFLTERLRSLTGRLFESAIKVLGKPPGDFTVVSLGSMARAEASPFSDLEFAILLPDKYNKELYDYAMKLSAHVRDQVIALGEDSSTERPGERFHFDSGNTPLNNESFIGSAKELVDRSYIQTTEEVSKMAAWQTATSLASAEWLFGSDAIEYQQQRLITGLEPTRSFDLLKQLHKLSQDRLEETPARDQPTMGEQIGRWVIGDGVKLFDRAMKSVAVTGGKGEKQEAQVKGNEKINVKNLARLPMMLAQGLAMERGLVTMNSGLDGEDSVAVNSTPMRVAELRKAGVLDTETANRIIDLQDRLGAIRVRAHLKAGEGDDVVSIRDEPELPGLIQELQKLKQWAEQYLKAPPPSRL